MNTNVLNIFKQSVIDKGVGPVRFVKYVKSTWLSRDFHDINIKQHRSIRSERTLVLNEYSEY